eukprot:jgi/Chlat1/7673/Chrsp64S07134
MWAAAAAAAARARVRALAKGAVCGRVVPRRHWAVSSSQPATRSSPTPPPPILPHSKPAFGRLEAAGALAVLLSVAYAATPGTKTHSVVSFFLSDALTPLFRLLDPETAHNAAIWLAGRRLTPREHRPDPPSLTTRVWGREFSNPIGLAAGFDKSAEAIDGLLGAGFGFVEIGSVTPQPQPGNPKPRVFRIPDERAVINRYGFNSDGVDTVANRLQQYRGNAVVKNKPTIGLLGVNLGKNKATEDAAADYELGVMALSRFADYLVVNVSSPNTPGLRALQGREQLESLVERVKIARDAACKGQQKPPLLVKIAPDLTHEDLRDVVAVALSQGIDGLIVSNTTIARPSEIQKHAHGNEVGGLSGTPLLQPSTDVLKEVYSLSNGKIPLIGCGGVSTGRDAYAKIRAGASLVQLYTALAYEGLGLVPRIKRELAECLAADGYDSVAEAVGADCRR